MEPSARTSRFGPASATTLEIEVSVDQVTAELRNRVRARLRERLLAHGGSRSFDDPELFAAVEHLLQTSIAEGDAGVLLLPELLGDADTWRLQTSMQYQSHRGTGPAALILFIKRRLMMPVVRWLFEYSRDNFERQRRVNQVLFACIQELAIENAALRQQIRARAPAPPGTSRSEAAEGR